jgi:hypothetical protein
LDLSSTRTGDDIKETKEGAVLGEATCSYDLVIHLWHVNSSTQYE